ncbi:REST corepressor isoform X2 [Condylostylus longicornis]|uniref:REST corepressor isoform X2 n=1 Tax=Condylostylus longicornis TaxID=2530218 RepID=UPI00244E4062|nr:REST corepressor isoform X2 [Condylostylus longicornis]
MVLAERHAELLRNGRRSRGPSPNGHNGGSPDTSSDEDNSIKRNGKTKAKQSEYEEKIRVGRDYQAVCPELIPVVDRKPELLNDRALLVWSPTKDIPDCKLEEYISVAKEKYGYNGEQALGMLFWHKHDLERAVMDLANFTPFPDEWTVEDKVLFEQAFQFHGKSFHRIRQMLPDKSIASLVKYYYSWKKTRHRQSVMDRQEKAKASKDGSENGSENGSNEESENDDKVQQNKQAISSLKRKISESCEDLRPIEQPNRINSRWSNEELSMAVHGVKKFGKDFQAIAEMLGTKTEAHVRTFFVNYRRRYNLDNVLKEFEAERTTNQTSEEEKPQDAINSDEKMSEKDITESKEEKKDDEILLQKNNIEEIEDKNIALLSNNTVTNEEFSNINDTTIDITVPEKTDITPQINSSENIIMEIDLDSEASESSSPIKKIKASETTPTQIKL